MMPALLRFLGSVLLGLSLGSSAMSAAQSDKVSPFLFGSYQKVSEVKKALSDHGFTVLSAEKIDKKGQLVTVVFTSKRLQKLSQRSRRGFGAVLRVLVNDRDHQIAVTNPRYFEKAFLQKEDNAQAVDAVFKKINETFPSLIGGEDALVFDALSSYHFMMGMPYYQDQIRIAQGKHADLIEKVKSYKGGKRTLFVLALNDHTALAGITLSKRTAKFIKKIGTRNAAVLPYVVLIEKDAAYILDPKYYLALNYPTLTMSQFMTIASVPGAIEKECRKVFK
jgi:hypothetical protein